MSHKLLLLCTLLVFTWIAIPSNATAQADEESTPITLKIGDSAPALKVAKWFKGKPVEKLEPGNVYVVEFWATWCGPCKLAMPHLSELAKKYADKVTFIGVSVWERPDPADDETRFAMVEQFVKGMGDKMAYNVAADDGTAVMSKTWPRAAGRTAIPCSFVIGKDGKIAWIGHPMHDLDKVIDQVLAGTFDTKGAATELAKQQDATREQATLMKDVIAARKANDPKAIVKAVDALLETHPTMEVRFAELKFGALKQTDEAQAIEYARVLIKEDRLITPMNPVSTSVVARLAAQLDGPKSTLKHPEPELALELLRRTNDATDTRNPGILNRYADALYRAGKLDAAVENKQKALVRIRAVAESAPDAAMKSRFLASADSWDKELTKYKEQLQAGPTPPPTTQKVEHAK